MANSNIPPDVARAAALAAIESGALIAQVPDATTLPVFPDPFTGQPKTVKLGPDTPATTKQINFLRALFQQNAFGQGVLHVKDNSNVYALQVGDLLQGGGFYSPPVWLTKAVASKLIDRIKTGGIDQASGTLDLNGALDVAVEFGDVSDAPPKVDPGSLDHIEFSPDGLVGVDLAAGDEVSVITDSNTLVVSGGRQGGKTTAMKKALAAASGNTTGVASDPSPDLSGPLGKSKPLNVSALINNVMHQVVLGDVDEAERTIAIAINTALQAGAEQVQAAEPAPEPAQIIYVHVDDQGREVPQVHKTARPLTTRPVRDLWPHVLGKVKGADNYGLPVWDAPPALRPILYDVSALHDKNDLRTICQVIQGGGHLWLTGQKGTGKTTLAMSIAQVCHRPFFRIQHHAQTEALDLLGSKGLRAGETVFEPGILLTAMQTAGAVILLDEPTLASLTLSVYQSILDEGFIQLDDRICRLAPGVTFICADNTSGSGDTSMIYHGTAPVNAAFLDRFDAMIKMDYLPLASEITLLSNLTKLPAPKCKTICTYAVKVRDAAHAGTIAEPISFRRLVAFAKALRAGVPKQVALANTILSFVVSPSDRETYNQLATAHL